MTQTKNKNSLKDDEAFKTILRGVERIMNEKLQTTIYRSMRIDDEIIDGYYILQWISEPYTLQEDKEMEEYTPSTTAYIGESVYDAVIINPVHYAKY